MKLLLYTALIALLAVFSACTYNEKVDPADCDQDADLILVSKGETQCNQTSGRIAVASQSNAEAQFSLDGSSFQNSGEFNGLAAGAYTVTAQYPDGCLATLDVVIENEDGVNITVETDGAGCNSNDGTIEVIAQGGVPPYQFAVDDSGLRADNIFTGLPSGQYTVKAVDASGCEIMQTVTLSSGVSFSADIQPIIAANCAITGCHAGNISPDLRDNSTIGNRAGRIRARTGNKTMPPPSSGIALSDEEIQKIACWADEGGTIDN